MASGVELVHLDGSDIPNAAWQNSLNCIAQGHRVSLITADGQTFDLNASDFAVEYSGGGSVAPPDVASQLLKQQGALQQQTVQQPQQPQMITIIQEDGTQQTLNVMQVGSSLRVTITSNRKVC